MSVQITKAVLKDFLSSSESNVLALTGAWGTGKTYAWRQALLTHKEQIKFKHYCYVSLFGINSMAELRMALFTKSTAIATLEQSYDFDTVSKHWGPLIKDGLKKQYERFIPLVKSLPHGSSLALSVEVFAPNTVRDMLICLDDFERQTSIAPEEILGLITELKEERSCKVALIFNAEHLKDESKDKYERYREKVVDLEILYSPTVQEAFNLVFENDFPQRDFIFRCVSDLHITNVRILRKLQQILSKIASETDGMHSDVVEWAISTTVVLCWCAYAADAIKPKLQDIEHWNDALMSFKPEAELDPGNLAWVRRLKAFGFRSVEDFDLAIARAVQRGYLEGTGFVEIAKQLDKETQAKEKAAQLNAVWRKFHGSFAGEDKEFVVELHAATIEGIASIGSGDLNSAVLLLRELKYDDLADDLIRKFVDTHKHELQIFNLRDHPFGGSINDKKLRDIFDLTYTSLKKLPTLEDAVVSAIKNSGWNEEDIVAMKKASVDEYEAMFLRTRDDVKLSSLIKWCLRWESGEYSEITSKAKQALERIKKTSLLNSVRVSRYGV